MSILRRKGAKSVSDRIRKSELAIKEHLIPAALGKQQIAMVYANEADILNMALFGMTAAQWGAANPTKKGNIRDHSNVMQLVCLANLENLNTLFVADGLPQSKRLQRLNEIAIQQMVLLTDDERLKLPRGKK